MAAINFPNSPTVGQTFTVGTQTWRYDGTAWVAISSERGIIIALGFPQRPLSRFGG